MSLPAQNMYDTTTQSGGEKRQTDGWKNAAPIRGAVSPAVTGEDATPQGQLSGMAEKRIVTAVVNLRHSTGEGAFRGGYRAARVMERVGLSGRGVSDGTFRLS